MPSYFRQVPDFDYVSRDSDQKQISEYTPVKNLFKRGKLRDDIFGNLSYFTKYKIIGDERPDNVAYKVYNDETLDWVILLSNNILNIQSEWPLEQNTFDRIMLEKYGSYDNLYNGIHHYETTEVRDSVGNLILPAGIRMPSQLKSGNGFLEGYRGIGVISRLVYEGDVEVVINQNLIDLRQNLEIRIQNAVDDAINGVFSIKTIERRDTNGDGIDDQTRFTIEVTGTPTSGNGIELEVTGEEVLEFNSTIPLQDPNIYSYQYYDNNLNTNVLVPYFSILSPVTNYQYESELENDKRNIYVLKSRYLNVVFNDMDEIMKYKKGSTQYVSRTLKRGDNIRLFLE